MHYSVDEGSESCENIPQRDARGVSFFMSNVRNRIQGSRGRSPSRRSPARDQALAKCSLDIVTGAQNLATLSPAELFDRERPDDLQAMFKLARNWDKQNGFVEQVNQLKLAFFHYGFRLVAAKKADKKKLAAWLEEDADRREALDRYIAAVWGEWLLLDNVVSFWREEKDVTPFLLLAESCRYTDAMGLERLKVDLGYKREHFTDEKGNPLPGWTLDEIKRYTSRDVLLSEEYDEYFRVLTRGLRGQGFGVPRLYRMFRTLSQHESMEVGESMLAYAGRLVLRTHSLGFEVRSASNAAKQAEYLWKAQRAKPIEDFFKGRQGFAETTKQFDHKIEYVWVDAKFYDARKWDTIVSRLLWWAGPLGYMLMTKQLQPFLLPMLRADALANRARVGSHLEVVLNKGFRPPVPVKVKWGDRCFNDLRLAWEMTKTLMQQGPVSLTTALEVADHDPELEAERKRDEASPSRNPELLPKFDPNHGNQPGQGKDGLRAPGGRPVGKPDPEGGKGNVEREA